MYKFPVLYAENSDKTIQQWQIIVDNDKYYTVYGRVGGAITVSDPTFCLAKNLGKKNATTANEQAVLEAQSKHQKKLDSGFYEDISLISNAKFIEPMLAKNYNDYSHTIRFPVFVQPKLDGIRCILTKDSMKSRKGKDIVACPHISQALKPVFDSFPDLVLDGELYNHKFKDDFNSICSLVRKTKPSQEDYQKSKHFIQYWVYDAVMPDLNFNSRLVALKLVAQKFPWFVKLCHTYTCNNHAEIDDSYEKFLANGFEGQMIRKNDIYYNKRTDALLKRKEFIDEEFEIVQVVEGSGNRGGMAGSLMLKNKKGQTFNANITGGFEFYQRCWNDRKILVGKQATIKYFCLTPDGIPRFPCATAIRDYE